MTTRCAVLLLVASMLIGCPYDRLRRPYVQNKADTAVEVQIVLIDGVEIVYLLHKDNFLSLLSSVEHATTSKVTVMSISRVTFIADGQVIDELDAERIATMLKCTADPRDVTWYIEAEGLRPSTPCRQATHDSSR